MNKKEPTTTQKYIQTLEASLESFWQIVIQLYFLIKSNVNINDNLFIFISLLFSIYNVATKMIGEDKIYFIESWQALSFNINKKPCFNSKYLARALVRFLDVFLRVLILSVLWIQLGSIAFAIYVVAELLLFIIVSYKTGRYVLLYFFFVDQSCKCRARKTKTAEERLLWFDVLKRIH